MKNYLMRKNDNSIDNFFQDFCDAFFYPVFGNEERRLMNTDIKETDKEYQMDVELPGFEKKDIIVEYEDGYVSISAKREEKESNSKYLAKERSTSYSRSFYVGDLDADNIKASYKDGILNLVLPKKVEESNKKGIQID